MRQPINSFFTNFTKQPFSSFATNFDSFSLLSWLKESIRFTWYRSFTQSFGMAITLKQFMRAMQQQLFQQQQLRQQPQQQHCATCHDGPKRAALECCSGGEEERRLRAAWRHEQQSIARRGGARDVTKPYGDRRLLLTPSSSNCAFNKKNELGSTWPDGLSVVRQQEAPPHPRPSASPEVAPCAAGGSKEGGVEATHSRGFHGYYPVAHRNLPSSTSSVTRPGQEGNRATSSCSDTSGQTRCVFSAR